MPKNLNRQNPERVGATVETPSSLVPPKGPSSPMALGARLLDEVLSHKGKTSGMGYTVQHVKPGRGFSAWEYSAKELPNGRSVSCKTFYPGPFDKLAGYPDEIKETYSVWVGWEAFDEAQEKDFSEPPIPLPEGATGWGSTAFDGPTHWYAEFGDDSDLAEAFGLSLPALGVDDQVPPFQRPR